MILSILVFISSSIFLFLSSKALLTHLIKFFYKITHSKVTSINLLFFSLLPGILLHELSHILSAEFLQVRTGELSLKPHFDGNHLKLGSAQIAHTDPIRLTLIGTAPFIAGSGILYLLLRLGLNLHLHSLTFNSFSHLLEAPWYLNLLIFYLIFAISNTMFSSPSDLKSVALPVILLLITTGVFQLTSLNLPLSLVDLSTNLFFLLSTVFFLTLVFNLLILVPLKLITRR